MQLQTVCVLSWLHRALALGTAVKNIKSSPLLPGNTAACC
jgi:hypothetical protein